MECPHCRSEIPAKPHSFALGEDRGGAWQVSNIRCPTCEHLVVTLGDKNKPEVMFPILPQAGCRARLSTDIPDEWSADYHTACRVLPHSAEASAALSRRLLHRVLAVKASAGHGSLSDQIRQAVISSDLPPYLKQALQTLTRIAKLEPGSAKSERPEALAPAEPGEAEWLLDILQSLFDLYFVMPANMERRQAGLEQLIASPQAAETQVAAAAAPAVAAPAPVAATAGGPAATPVPAAAGAAAAAPAADSAPEAPQGGADGSISI